MIGKTWDAACDITSVTPGGPASQGGLLTGDLITAIDGLPIRVMDDVGQALNGKGPGTKVQVTVNRVGVERQQEVTLGRRLESRVVGPVGELPPPPANSDTAANVAAPRPRLGVRTLPVSDEVRQFNNLPDARCDRHRSDAGLAGRAVGHSAGRGRHRGQRSADRNAARSGSRGRAVRQRDRADLFRSWPANAKARHAGPSGTARQRAEVGAAPRPVDPPARPMPTDEPTPAEPAQTVEPATPIEPTTAQAPAEAGSSHVAELKAHVRELEARIEKLEPSLAQQKSEAK